MRHERTCCTWISSTHLRRVLVPAARYIAGVSGRGRRRVLIVLGALAALTLGGAGTSVEADAVRPQAVIVGDSLTGGNASYIVPTLRSAGLDVRVEGLSARRIAVSFHSGGYRDSGIARIRSLKAQGVVPALWVIELGTNDLAAVRNCGCSDPVTAARSLIDSLLAELGPDVPVAWVTVMHRGDYEVTNWFNEALRRRAATDPYFRLIDWGGLSMGRPEWFLDEVHQNQLGVQYFTQMYIDDITALLRDLPGPPARTVGLQRAQRLGYR